MPPRDNLPSRFPGGRWIINAQQPFDEDVVRFPPEAGQDGISVLGVAYAHITFPNGDDLYLTRYGVPFVSNLFPESHWRGDEWFTTHSTRLFGHHTRLEGSSCVYRVRTEAADGRRKDVVLKWNRMGQDVPGSCEQEDTLDVEFNSPYEEFELVMEMRSVTSESGRRIRTHKPLAIYVPAGKVELWQSGRQEEKIQAKIQKHSDVKLDMFRSYAVIYEWIKGIDAAEACEARLLTEQEKTDLTLRVERDMAENGFMVSDRKPHHIIVRNDCEGNLVRDREGGIAYAVVDFELLARTPEREAIIRQMRRGRYLRKQVRRFETSSRENWPTHLHSAGILGIDYVWGRAESTGGALWVVGRDPSLFDYFLPERWHLTPRTRLSVADQIYQVTSKDNVKLVWKVSRVGQRPDMDPFKTDERKILDHGYNSPFEEIALSIYLSNHGVPTTYPRAVYMAGHMSEMRESLLDETRYESHRNFMTPDGQSVLRKDRDYILIWGYWNKPDEMLAEDDRDYYLGIDALHAARQGVLTKDAYLELMTRTRARLTEAGVEDLNLRGNHILLSMDKSGLLVVDEQGRPEARICNFELLKRL